jgi:AraC-like DNA-binding protein
VLEYIDAEKDSELTLDALAEIAGLNPFCFARTFRRQFGESPHRYSVQGFARILKVPTSMPRTVAARGAVRGRWS